MRIAIHLTIGDKRYGVRLALNAWRWWAIERTPNGTLVHAGPIFLNSLRMG